MVQNFLGLELKGGREVESFEVERHRSNRRP